MLNSDQSTDRRNVNVLRVDYWVRPILAAIGVFLSCALGGWAVLEDSESSNVIELSLIVICGVIAVALIIFDHYKTRKEKLESDRTNEKQQREMESLHTTLKIREQANDELNAKAESLVIDNKHLKSQLTKSKANRLIYSVSIQIDAFDCKQKIGQNSLKSLYEYIRGTKLHQNQFVEMEIDIVCKPLHVSVYGARIGSREEWHFRVGSFEGRAPLPGSKWHTRIPKVEHQTHLVDLVINSEILKKYITIIPSVYDFVPRFGSLKTLDPSHSMGFFKVKTFRTASISESEVKQIGRLIIPYPAGSIAPDLWQNLPIVDEVAKQWSIQLQFNNKYSYVNLMRPEGFASTGSDVRRRFFNLHIRAKYKRETEIWMAPLSHEWTDFKPIMSPPAKALLYGDLDASHEE